jgi:glycerol-3-phosphate acyltransferase PlsX
LAYSVRSQRANSNLSMIKVAVDASGGDLGSAPVLAGVRGALNADPDIFVSLFCDPASHTKALNNSILPKSLRNRFSLHLCGESVAMDDKPLQALRNKASSSMAMALESVAQKDTQAMISSGNTGALVGFGLQLLGTIPGVTRPAICTALPSSRGRTWFLDMGANLEPTLEQMLANARMGASQCRLFDGIQSPRVGVLSVGSESIKGTQIQQDLATELTKEPGIEFVGFAEGADLFAGAFDLVVCDGLTGNVALKTAEGVAHFLSDELKAVLSRHWLARISYLLLRQSLKEFRRRMDPSRYNGAAFLGLDGLVVKSHGASDSGAFQNALLLTTDMVRLDALSFLKGELK